MFFSASQMLLSGENIIHKHGIRQNLQTHLTPPKKKLDPAS